MKISAKYFVIAFLIGAFAFQFITNSLLGPEIRLFPQNGDFFPGADSPVGWQSSLAKILFPIKFILIGPFPAVFKGPDPAPPVLVITFAIYWTSIALLFYFIMHKIFNRRII